MAKILTVEEALEKTRAKKNAKGKIVINRFNKSNFNTLMLAMANDVDFTTQVAKKVKDDVELEDVMVTKSFRKWCKRLLESAGMDKSESEKVLTKDFTIDNVDGLYEFFTTAVYLYLDAGNRFDFPNKKDFQGGIVLSDKEESEKIYEARNPKDGKSLGKVKTKKGKHKALTAKSTCPSYLTEKRKV